MGYSKWNYVKQHIKQSIRVIKNFGFSYGLKRLFLGLVPRRVRNNSKICKHINAKCSLFTMGYLEKKYKDVIKNYDCQESKECIGLNSNIWVFWWQGYEQAPSIVKACIESIKRNAGNHPVVLLDKNNYEQYIMLPYYIVDKLKKGAITLTHLSDLFRAYLLYQYGGIWMDATIYMLHPLDESIEKSTFYTINHMGNNPPMVQSGRWTGFFLACCKGNDIIGLLRELLLEYWKQEEESITYLFMDYFLTMIYENVEDANRIIQSVPISNKSMLELDRIINQDCEKLKQLENDDTYLYKLSYKKKFVNEVNGKETVYYWLINYGWSCENYKGGDL